MRWIKAWKQFHKHIAAHQNLSGAIIAFHGQRLYSSWRVMIFFCSVKVMKAILMAVTRVCTWKRFMNEWCSPAQREKKPLYMFTPPTLLVGIPWKEEKVPPWSEGTYFSSIHVQPMPSPKKNRKEKKVKHRRGATEKNCFQQHHKSWDYHDLLRRKLKALFCRRASNRDFRVLVVDVTLKR